MKESQNCIKFVNGRPQIHINERIYASMAFATLGSTTYLKDDYLRRLGEAGIELFFIHSNLLWQDDPRLSLDAVKNNLERLLRQVPGAKVFLRLNLHPPKEWLENHPEELFRCENGDLKRVDYVSVFHRWENMPIYSLVSSKWREDASKELKKFLVALDNIPNSNAIVGHFLAAGGTSEWIQYGGKFDYGDAFMRHFRKWLKQKYNCVENLRKAWGQNDIDFSNANIPSGQRLKNYKPFDLGESVTADFFESRVNDKLVLGAFWDPHKACDILDYSQAYGFGVVESINYFAKVVKKHSKCNLFVGAFHGCLANQGLRQELLESKNIDFLANPGVYINRRPGAITDIHCMADSFLLHNKIYFVEDDTRTHLAPPIVKENYFINSVEDGLCQMKRDFGRDLCRNLYGWWFDMYDPDGHSKVATIDVERKHIPPPEERGTWWYDDPQILQVIKKIQKIAHESTSRDCKRQSEIAVIMDEQSVMLSSVQSNRVTAWRLTELAKLGTPIDFFYCDDLKNERMRDYKLYIFANSSTLSNAQHKTIADKVRRNNATVLWTYASGVHDPSTNELSTAHMERLTGLKFKRDDTLIDTAFELVDNPITSKCPTELIYGRISEDIYLNGVRKFTSKESPNLQTPNFFVDDSNAKVLAHFKANGEVALACREFESWNSIYCATQFMQPELLRAIAEYAGCHIVCNSNDFIFLNKSYLSIHAASEGVKKIALPEACSPFELYSERSFGNNTASIEVPMKHGETLTFRLDAPSE
jgi:hypothetical protein